MLLAGLKTRQLAYLVLADGTVFPGYSIGVNSSTVGEVVFNTSMTGYQEILTDPSYDEQIVTLTYPHIGNVGINQQDMESPKIWAKGLIIRDLSPIVSNWRAQQSLVQFLNEQNMVAIAGVDTRRLTRLVRQKGAQKGCITVGNNIQASLAKADAFPGLVGKDLASKVSNYAIDPLFWGKENTAELIARKWHVVLVDCGYKRNIFNLLEANGCRVTIVSAQTSAEDILKLKPHGVVYSNGPGDPGVCDYAIQAIQELLQKNIPIFGICLGCQLLALALGAKTIKMKLGHHGSNHPVQDLKTKKVFISSQNHEFSIDETSLPKDIEITYRSLFDGSIQGIKHKTKKAFAFQGHPEASPGPRELEQLFKDFIGIL